MRINLMVCILLSIGDSTKERVYQNWSSDRLVHLLIQLELLLEVFFDFQKLIQFFPLQ